MDERFVKRLEEAADRNGLADGRYRHVLFDEPMSRHTTFRIGGLADYYVTPATAEGVRNVLKLCQEEKCSVTVIGNGSNLLVSDRGIRGVVLSTSALAGIKVWGQEVYCGAGELLSALAMRTAKEGLAGLAYAGGIPGTLGGGIVMNAGAYGGELADNLVSAQLLSVTGEFRTVPAKELELGYRTSRMQHTEEIVLGATFRLELGNPEAILASIQDFNARRREKQPLEYPSAGSTFKRPAGFYAGKLIQDAGLAGFSVGDAQVSQKHCGFIINRGRATAAQVLELIKQVQNRVWEMFRVKLEPEIRILGELSQ